MTQLATKFILDNAINGAKLRLRNNEAARALNSSGSDVNLFKYSLANALELLQLPEAEATLPIPSADKQFATIEYIKKYVEGKVDAKDSVFVLADTDIALTGTASGFTIDGVVLGTATATPPRRVGLIGQTDATKNGIYDYIVSGSNYTLTRSSDFDQVDDPVGNEVTQGAYFLVVNGTEYSGFEVILTTDDPIVIDTTPLTFAKVPTTLALTAGDMLVRVGNDFSVDLLTNGGLTSSNPGNPNGQLQVKINTALLEKDQTVRIDTNGNVVAKRSRKLSFTLNSTHITNQSVELDAVASMGSVVFDIVQAPPQHEGIDYSVNYTGGPGGTTKITFLNGLATGGVSALAAGDLAEVQFTSY